MRLLLYPFEKHKNTALLICLIGVIFFHLYTANDYSINWDFHHIFYAGLKHLHYPITEDLWWNLPFREPDPRLMTETPFGPLQTTLPALGFIVFYKMFHILPFDTAFGVPAIIGGILGISVVYLFLRLTLSRFWSLMGALFLALYPRFWGDMHTNVKDIPTAALFAATIYFSYRVLNKRKLVDGIIGALLFALTFNYKVNAIFIPPIIGIWYVVVLSTKQKHALTYRIEKLQVKTFSIPLLFAVLSMIFAFLLWSFFWPDPIGQFIYMVKFFQDNTQNMEVLLLGNWYCSAKSVPWYYPYVYLGVVTPMPILIFFITGLVIALYRSVVRALPIYSLLVLWFFIPLIRYMSPSIGVIDGIRHFQEVLYPMIIMATFGVQWITEKIAFKQGKHFGFILLFCYLIGNIILYHPFQLSYFNEFVGGIWGAYTKFDMDYWGISQKQAIEWLNQNAPKDSVVHIAMSGDTAGWYLRPDLRSRLNTTWFDDADFVVVLNRQSFFYRYWWLWEYFLRRKTTHTVSLHGIPMTWIYDNRLGTFTRRENFWQGESPCIRKYWTP